MSLLAPVLVMGFNRPELLEVQLESLIKIGSKVYVSLDVPKESDFANAELSRKCIAIVNRFSDDLFDVRISKENLGSFRGVTEAITWGFSRETNLIILEDDVFVSEIFLSYATKLLMNFESNKSIGSIAGTNFVPKSHITLNTTSIRLSAFTSSWGWATWSDRWDDYLGDLTTFPIHDFVFPTNFWSWKSKRYWERVFVATAYGKYDAWDYRWLYSNWKRRRLTVVPNSNLVINVGFGEGATHTTDSKLPWWLPREIDNYFDLGTIPLLTIRDEKADRWAEENHYRTTWRQQLRSLLSTKFPRTAETYRRVIGRTK
jgi:hypothetical protein